MCAVSRFPVDLFKTDRIVFADTRNNSVVFHFTHRVHVPCMIAQPVGGMLALAVYMRMRQRTLCIALRDFAGSHPDTVLVFDLIVLVPDMFRGRY